MKDNDEGATQYESDRVDVERFPSGKSVVRVSGELLRETTAQMVRTVQEELARVPSPLVLDLSAVTNISFEGVDALVWAATMAGESDIPLCLFGVEGRPAGVALAAADLTELFEVIPSRGSW
jgi:anti-sigma B factor antagonist